MVLRPDHQVGALRGPSGRSDWGSAHQAHYSSRAPDLEISVRSGVFHPITNFAGRHLVKVMLSNRALKRKRNWVNCWQHSCIQLRSRRPIALKNPRKTKVRYTPTKARSFHSSNMPAESG